MIHRASSSTTHTSQAPRDVSTMSPSGARRHSSRTPPGPRAPCAPGTPPTRASSGSRTPPRHVARGGDALRDRRAGGRGRPHLDRVVRRSIDELHGFRGRRQRQQCSPHALRALFTEFGASQRKAASAEKGCSSSSVAKSLRLVSVLPASRGAAEPARGVCGCKRQEQSAGPHCCRVALGSGARWPVNDQLAATI